MTKTLTTTLSPRAAALAGGVTRYFTGVPCKYGHISERWTLSAACLACEKVSRAGIAERYKLARAESDK